MKLTEPEKRHILWALGLIRESGYYYGPKNQFNKRDLRIVDKLLNN